MEGAKRREGTRGKQRGCSFKGRSFSAFAFPFTETPKTEAVQTLLPFSFSSLSSPCLPLAFAVSHRLPAFSTALRTWWRQRLLLMGCRRDWFSREWALLHSAEVRCAQQRVPRILLSVFLPPFAGPSAPLSPKLMVCDREEHSVNSRSRSPLELARSLTELASTNVNNKY